jgi:hypothetical protein
MRREALHERSPLDKGSTGYYRAIARSIRALAPELKTPEARKSLQLLAADYERLADYVEAVSGILDLPAPAAENGPRH